MAGKGTWQGKAPRRNPVPVSDLAAAVLDPVLRKRAGISIGLVQSWEEIVGPRLAGSLAPGKDPLAAPPARGRSVSAGRSGDCLRRRRRAPHLQHETGEIIARVNAFLGFAAIGQIRIVQKPLAAAVEKPKPALRRCRPPRRQRLAGTLAEIEDEGLRAALERLGETILGSRDGKR